MELAKQIAHGRHAKVNDVVLIVVAGGLRELLGQRRGPRRVDAARKCAISLPRQDPGQALGNQDGWMVVPLPLGEPDAAARLQLIAAETAARKDKIHPQVGSGIFRFALAQRVFPRLFAHQRLMNVTATNVAGPPVPLYLAGAPLLELFPVVSLVANLPPAVAALSYAGQLTLTAVADIGSYGDVDVFAKSAQNTLDELTRALTAAS